MKHTRIASITTLFVVVQALVPTQWLITTDTGSVQATYLQNDNAGSFELTFLNPEGIVHREGMSVTGGVAFLSENALTGSLMSVQVEPASMRRRDTVTLNTTTPSGSKFFMTVVDCEQETPLAGWERVPYTGQPLSLSSIDASTYTCLQVQVDVERTSENDPSPIISKLALHYVPFPVLTAKVSLAGSKAETCNNITYQVNFTNNYVNDMGVVLYVPLPRAEAGTITGYDESLDLYPRLNPVFVRAEGGGKYTNTGIIVNNKEVPAESVYRDLGVLNAGETRMYGFTITIPCDTMNATTYLTHATIAGTLADRYDTAPISTTISAQARPALTKNAQGVFSYENKNYLYLAYNPTLTYVITAHNSGGTEAINKPVITDNLSYLQSQFATGCGALSLAERISDISDGGILSGTTLTWNLANIGRNQKKAVSYKVNFSGCNINGTQFTNTAQLSAKNISPLSASYTIQLLNQLSPGIAYFKTILGTTKLYYEDMVTYQLQLRNIGPIRLEDISFTDSLPTGLELVSAEITSNQGGNVLISGNDLQFTISGCVNSQFFPTPSNSYCYGNASTATVIIKAKIKTPVNACQSSVITNTANYAVQKISSTHYNDDNSMTITSLSGGGSISFSAQPRKGDLEMNIIGPKTLKVKEKGTYTLTIANKGKDTSRNTDITLLIPKLSVNGVEKYVSIINVEGGIVDYSDIANGKITIHVEEILEGRTKQISFGVGTIPSGIKEGSDITLQALVVGVDDLCGKFSATANITTTIIANPTLGYKSLYVYKTSKASYLLSKDAVEYQMMVQNVGSLTTSEVYVVDILPAKSSFIEAYTTATTPADTYQCVGCEVYFSKANANLPKKFDPLQPFTTAMIKSYFTKGTENAGVRTSPYGEETKYVAYLVDDTTKNPSLLPVGGGGEKKVGIKIQDKGSKIGSLLTNGVAVFSKDLMQSIGNPKGVTVLEYPGLMTRMESDKDIVNACESFERNIGYNHDGTAENHSTTLTVRLPNTVKLATGSDAISHSWSNKTALEGGLSTNYQAIRNNNNLTIGEMNGETVITMNVNGYLGSNLQPERGGNLKIKVQANCDNASDTMVIGTVVGYYENAINFGSVGSEDTVHIKNPDLYLRKAVDRRDPLIGEEIAYTLTLANKGERYASNVSIQDYFPEGICYQSGSTLILEPMFWEIGEPHIEGDCLSGGQILTWSNDYGNALTFPGTASGSITKDSEDIYLRYKGKVEGNIALGVSLINGAKITTTDTQDNNYDKEDEEEVMVPFPNLYVQLSSPLVTEGGSLFDYTLQYGNQSRMCAEKPSIILTVPLTKGGSEAGGLAPLATFKALSANKGETFYSISCSGNSTLPTFHRDTPTSGGRATGIIENACFIAIKIAEETFCASAGSRNIIMTMQATNSTTHTKLPAGTELTAQANITNRKGEADPTNNHATSTTRVPAMDLWIDITGTPEGLTPGLLPNKEIIYRITFGNQGNELSCANSIKFTADENVEMEEIVVSTLSITDENGQALKFRTPQDTEIGFITPVTVTTIGKTYVFKLEDKVCFPGKSQGAFELFARTKNNLLDSTPIAAKVEIWEDSPAKEDTMLNNEAISSTMVYLADVMVEKSAIVDSNADGLFSGNDSTEIVSKGKKIRYRLAYHNIGNYSAENVVLRDKLPADTCFVIGSVVIPEKSWIEYSNDKGMTWSYVSDKAEGEQDCAITDFRIVLADKLTAPGHSVEGGLHGTGGWNNLDALLSKLPITKNTSEAVATFTIQGIPYLAFANAHRKNEVRKWNGDGFTDISDNIPNSIYTDKQGTTGFTNTKGVTTFNIGGTTYLAFANSSQKNEVRKWNGDGFTDISDNIPHSTYDYYSNSVSSDAYGVTSFEIDGETYLAFANMGGGSLQAQPNEVRKWNGDGFTDISTTIPSTKNNSYGVTSVEIGGETYLAFAGSNGSESELWKWNGNGFTDISSANPTVQGRAYGVTNFKIGTDTYLMFFKTQGSQKYELWKWNGNGFTDISTTISMSTGNVYGATSFLMGGDTHLALACDGQQNELWKWNGNNFEKASGTIPMTTYNTKEVTSFEVNGETYLAFANQNQKNEVRKWNGNEFIDTRENSIPFTKSNTKEVTSFEINGETYLAFANQYQKNGVRKWNGKRFTDISDNIPNPLPDERGNIEYTNSQAVTSFEIAGITYLAFANQYQKNEIRKWNGDRFIDISDKVPNPLPNKGGHIEYSSSQAVTSFEIAGTTYLAFANSSQKNEVRKWNGDRFIDISDKVPDTLPDEGGYIQYANSQAVTSFEMAGTTCLAFANSSQKNEIRKWNGDRFTDISDNIPNPLPDERGNIEYTNSQAVTSFEIAGITYLAFANQYRKNEVRKWNGNRFIDISDKVPDTLPDKRGNRQYSDSQAVTSFEIEDTTYLAFANQRQQNEVRKWNGNGFTDISATLPPVEGINHSWNGVTHFKQGGKLYLAFADSMDENLVFQYKPGEYMTTGSRIIELVADNSLKSRNKLYINASINKGGEIKYTVYDNAGLSGISLLTETNPTGYLDLSSLTFTGTLYVEIAVISPEVEIRDYKATYFSTITPKIELEAQVKDDSILSDEIINTAYISTTTPESNTTNNTHMYTLYTEATDLSITKSVDNASVAINDELTYTITYENKGPKDATNVVISDVLPKSFKYVSSSPQLVAPITNFTNGYWRLEYENIYYDTISFELKDGTGNILAQKAQGTSIGSDGTFTGHLTVGGAISLTRTSNGEYYDGTYKLYIDEVLVLNVPTRYGNDAKIADTHIYTGFVPIIEKEGYTLEIPTLPIGSGGSIQLKAKVTTGYQGQIFSNMAQISSDTAELFPGDNLALAMTTLGNIANLYTKATLPPTYSPNALLSANVEYGNNGNQATSGTQLVITLDEHFTLSSATTGYTLSGKQLVWDIGTLPINTSGTMQLQLQVANNPLLVEDNTPLVLTASLTSQTTELNLADNLATAQTLPLQGGTLTLEGNAYIDVDGSHSLSENDTRLPGQKVLYSGMQITGEVQTDVDGHYQIIGLEPGRYELQLFPLTGYDSVFSKGGKNLTAQAVGSGSLDGATDKDKIISIRGYAEDTISELDFGLDNTALTNVYTKIKLAGTQDEAVTLDVEYGNTTNINAKSVLLQIQLDPNVIYVNTSHPHAVYDSTQHKVSLSLGELTANQQHFSINVRLDTTALTGDTIRYHAFNFVSTISTATLPEITNLDNIASIDQRIITVGDIYGNVYEDKDKLLGRNPLRDEMLSGYAVVLQNLSGNIVATTTTNASGAYAFLNVKPGTYQLIAPATGDYHNFGAFPGSISGTAILMGMSISPSTLQLEVQADTIYAENHFSVITLPSVLKGTIALDSDMPLHAIEVHLKAPNGKLLQTAYTNTSGEYAFMQVEAGEYSITYVLPSYYTAESANVGTLGGVVDTGQQEVASIPVQFDQQGLAYDFVLQAMTGHIGGMMYQVNTQGEFLRPSSGVVVYLHNAPVNTFAISTTTGEKEAIATGTVSPITGNVATGMVSPITGNVATGTVSPITGNVATGMVSPITGNVATGMVSLITGNVATGMVSLITGNVATGMVSLITGEIITGSKQGQSPDTTEQGATPLDSIDDEQDTPPLDSITTTGEQATPSLDSIDSTTEQESILSGEIPLVMPLSAIAMTTTDAQGNFSFPVNDAGMYYLTYTLVAPHSVYDAYPGKNPLTNTPNAAKINQAELQVILLTGDSSIGNAFAVQVPPTSATLSVYRDTNNNGTYQAGTDQLLSGVTVSLSQAGQQLAVGLTPATAGYLFADLLAGTYQASYVVPNGYLAASATTSTFTLSEGDTKDIFFPVRKKTPYDLELRKTVDKTTAQPGDILTYTLTVNNLGNSLGGTNILIRDTLPLGLEWIGDDGSLVSYADGGARVFRLPSLAAGMTAQFTFQTKIPTTLTTSTVYTNEARVISTSPLDTNSLNDIASATTTVNLLPNNTGGQEGGGSGGGGGGTELKKDDCPQGDNSPSYYDNICEVEKPTEKPVEKPTEEGPKQPDEKLVKETPTPSQPSSPAHSAPSLPEEDDEYGQQHFQTPTLLPKTGPEETSQGIKILKPAKMDITYPDWFQPSRTEDIGYWKSILPTPEDRNAPVYLVIPSIGAVVPIREMDNPTDRANYLGTHPEQVNINTYLQNGVLHYPGSASYGENGNAVILGHSSYFANDTGRYKTIFQAILRLHSEDVIWVYQQNASGTYERYTYTVEASFETNAENVGVLSPGYGKHLTLITCTPIGTTLQRRVVRATLTGVEK